MTTIEQRVERFLLLELSKPCPDLQNPDFKNEFNLIFLIHGNSDKSEYIESGQLLKLRDRIWEDILNGKIQTNYLTQNKIILPLV